MPSNADKLREELNTLRLKHAQMMDLFDGQARRLNEISAKLVDVTVLVAMMQHQIQEHLSPSVNTDAERFVDVSNYTLSELRHCATTIYAADQGLTYRAAIRCAQNLLDSCSYVYHGGTYDDMD